MIIFDSSARRVLKQDAVLTFTLLKAGRSLERKRRGFMFENLCDIAYIPSQKKKYYEELRKIFQEWQGIERKPAMQVSLTDPNLGAILGRVLM